MEEFWHNIPILLFKTVEFGSGNSSETSYPLQLVIEVVELSGLKGDEAVERLAVLGSLRRIHVLVALEVHSYFVVF